MATHKIFRMTLLGLFVLLISTSGAAAQEASMVVDGGIQFGDGTIQYSALVGYAPVGDSGQKRCWDDEGDQIACVGTGQDGERQSGSDWPSPRFDDNGDGTVSDVLTGLIWLRDADCFGTMYWTEALTTTADLMTGSCELDDESLQGDWRLPTIRELSSLIDFGESSPALVKGHPFADVRDGAYWTSTTAVEAPNLAWAVGLGNGFQDSGPKGSLALHAWPVRGGQ